MIEKFTEDITDFNLYQNDLKTQSAVERQLVIIGEALNKLNKIEKNLEIKNDKRTQSLFTKAFTTQPPLF